jgi:hypothetical protein
MANPTWYSQAGADAKFATKAELEQAKLGAKPAPAPDLSGYATKSEMTAADSALSSRIATVSSKADAALPAATASSTYATKSEVAEVKASIPQPTPAPDLAPYAKKADTDAADLALGKRIDDVKTTADSAAPRAALSEYQTKAGASSTFATKEALAGYLSTTDAASTYATKAELAQAQIGGGAQAPDLSGLATKAEVSSADAALGARIDQVKGTADAALPKSDAASTYATKEALTTATAPISPLSSKVSSLETTVGRKADTTALVGFLPKAEATATYATKEDLSAVRSAIPTVPPAPDLSPYLRTADADGRYASKEDLAKAQAGGNVDLSSYLTRDDAYGTFVQQENLERQLGQYATLEALNAETLRVDAMAKNIAPFRPGERYYSPVTYFWPDYYQKPLNVSKWAQILKFAGTLGIVVLNRNSGNWDTYDKDFDTQAKLALAAGARRAVFYVKTQYLAATLPAGDPGRNNVPDVDKYTPDYIFGQIAKAKSQYGDVCQGVFLDETINGWGAQAGRVPAYKALIDRIRTAYGKDFLIVVNAGSNISEEMCRLDFDVCMMFEKDATAFLNEDPGTPILPDHMKAYPSTRWWAVVHGVTSENYRKVFEKANGLGIAHLYITDGQLREDPQHGGQWEPVGNPYANPPSDHIHELVVPWLKGYLPLKLEVDDLRSRPRVLSLGKHEAVPAGTPAGTIIIRKEN